MVLMSYLFVDTGRSLANTQSHTKPQMFKLMACNRVKMYNLVNLCNFAQVSGFIF